MLVSLISKRGLPVSEDQVSTDSLSNNEYSAVDKRRKLSHDLGKWFFGLSVIFMVISIAASLGSSSARTDLVDALDSYVESENIETNNWDSSWVPSGFTAWSIDSNIAWRWTPKNNYSCDSYDCLSAEFISQTGCPSGLYAALNWLDSNGSVVAYDNASLPSLLPMQTAKLKFEDIQDSSSSGQIAEINCR